MDKKKGWESNYQFDSQPLKVNRSDFFACKQHIMYHWKAFDKGYNFVSNLTYIMSLSFISTSNKNVVVKVNEINENVNFKMLC